MRAVRGAGVCGLCDMYDMCGVCGCAACAGCGGVRHVRHVRVWDVGCGVWGCLGVEVAGKTRDTAATIVQALPNTLSPVPGPPNNSLSLIAIHILSLATKA